MQTQDWQGRKTSAHNRWMVMLNHPQDAGGRHTQPGLLQLWQYLARPQGSTASPRGSLHWTPIGSGQGQAAIAVVQQRKQLLVNFINMRQSLSWFSSRRGCGSASRRSFVCCCLPPGCREGQGCSLSLPQRADLEGGGKRGCEWKNSTMTASPEETGVQREGDTPEDTWWQSRNQISALLVLS